MKYYRKIHNRKVYSEQELKEFFEVHGTMTISFEPKKRIATYHSFEELLSSGDFVDVTKAIPANAKQVSTNCFVRHKVNTCEELMRLVRQDKSVYTIHIGVKPAVWLANMNFSIIYKWISYGDIWIVEHADDYNDMEKRLDNLLK